MAASYLTYKAHAYSSNTIPISSITTTGFVNGQTVIIAFCFAFGSSQPTITKPDSTWTQIGSDIDVGSYCRAACYWHVWATGETAYTWATTNTTYGHGCIMAFNGVDWNVPVDTSNTGKAASGLTMTVTTINDASVGNVVIGMGGNYRSSSSVRTFSGESCTNTSTLTEAGEGASATYVNVFGSYIVWTGSGATGDFTCTISGTNSGWIGFLVSLNSQVRSISVSETPTVTDNITVRKNCENISVSDSPTVTDVLSTPSIGPKEISVSDSPTVTDVVSSIYPSYLQIPYVMEYIPINDGALTVADWWDFGRHGWNYGTWYNSYTGVCFTAIDGVLDSVKFAVWHYTGNPTGNIVVQIYAMTGTYGTSGKPTGSVLATSDNVDVATGVLNYVGDNAGQNVVTFPFSGANRITLTDRTNYCAIMYWGGGDDSNNLTDAHEYPRYSAHPGNTAYSSNGSSWSINSSIKQFYVYEQPTSGVTLTTSALLLSVSDSPTVTESITVQTAGGIAVAEINVSDTPTVEDVIPTWSTAEQTSITEYISVTTEVPLTFSTYDTTIVTDEIPIYYVGDTATTTEYISLSVQSPTTPDSVSVSETPTVTESVTIKIPILHISVSEVPTVTDVLVEVRIPTLHLNVYDSPTVTENISAKIPILYINTYDSPTVTESQTLLIPILYINTYDSPTVTDSITVTTSALLISLYDSPTVTDNLTGIKIPILHINVNETPTVTESITVFSPSLTISVYESPTATDNATISSPSTKISVSDTPTATDYAVISSPITYINLNETPTASDYVSLTVVSPGAISVNEVPTVSDWVSLLIPTLHINTNDTPTVTENRTVSTSAYLISVIDTPTGTESVTILIPTLHINVNDTPTVIDYILLSTSTAGLSISISDLPTVTEYIKLNITVLGINVYDSAVVTDFTDISSPDTSISVYNSPTVLEGINILIPYNYISVFDSCMVTDYVSVSKVFASYDISVYDYVGGDYRWIFTDYNRLAMQINGNFYIHV